MLWKLQLDSSVKTIAKSTLSGETMNKEVDQTRKLRKSSGTYRQERSRLQDRDLNYFFETPILAQNVLFLQRAGPQNCTKLP